MARPRDVPAAAPKATNGPIYPTPRWPRTPTNGFRRTACGKTALADISVGELDYRPSSALLPWNLKRRLDAEAPTHFSAPSGSSVPIDYDAEEGPKLAIRVQELFGLDRHPSIAGGKVPLVVELLSPAHRPVQVTRDLPGFWRGSYAAVKADDARPLSAPSLAGRSAEGARHPPRQAARHLIH